MRKSHRRVRDFDKYIRIHTLKNMKYYTHVTHFTTSISHTSLSLESQVIGEKNDGVSRECERTREGTDWAW